MIHSGFGGVRRPAAPRARRYGDNDRLPSGNLLTSFWASEFDVREWARRDPGSEQFDARAQEIVRSTQLPAWRASVQVGVAR